MLIQAGNNCPFHAASITMSATDPAQTTSIPQITESDLRGFHTKHVDHTHEPASFFASDAEDHAEEASYDDEDDDGLGYYPDGAKRTLTDDQIAMFRHTEMQVLLRDRRRQAEDADSDAEQSMEEAGPNQQAAVVESAGSASKEGKASPTAQEVPDLSPPLHVATADERGVKKQVSMRLETVECP